MLKTVRAEVLALYSGTRLPLSPKIARHRLASDPWRGGAIATFTWREIDAIRVKGRLQPANVLEAEVAAPSPQQHATTVGRAGGLAAPACA